MSKSITTDELLTRAERLASQDHGGRFTLVHGADGYRGHFGDIGEQVFGPTDTANELLDVMIGTVVHQHYAEEPLDRETEAEFAEMERDEESSRPRRAKSSF